MAVALGVALGVPIALLYVVEASVSSLAEGDAAACLDPGPLAAALCLLALANETKLGLTYRYGEGRSLLIAAFVAMAFTDPLALGEWTLVV